MRRRINIIESLDWLTVGLYIVLICAGWLNIYAAVYNEEINGLFDLNFRSGKQFLWIILAIVLAFFILIIDSRSYSFFAYIIYGLAIFSLLIVLIFGKEVHGSRSWISMGAFQFQPSEFAKMATSLALARYMSSFFFKITKYKHVILATFFFFIPMLLILIQPDAGSALIYFSFFLVLYREGLPEIVIFIIFTLAIIFFLTLVLDKTFVLLVTFFITAILYVLLNRKMKHVIYFSIMVAFIAGLLWFLNSILKGGFSLYYISISSIILSSLIFMWIIYKNRIRRAYFALFFLFSSIAYSYSVDYVFNDVLEQHQRTRINILLGFEDDPLGVGYNVNQSKIAIGSGGFSGKGFLKGTQTKFQFVPEQTTDFIFCTVGEEWGFIGTSLVVVIFVFLLLRIVFLSERQRSSFSRIYGYCVFSIILFHFVINIGMTIGLFPVIGIPLPFFSYGGSSLWAFTALLFVFLRLDASRKEILR